MAVEKEGQYYFSNFLKEIRKGGEVVLFNSLSPNPSRSVNSELWDGFKKDIDSNKHSELFRALIQLNLIIPSQEADLNQLRLARESFINSLPKSPTTLYLVLSDRCNMKCDYCPFAQPEDTLEDQAYMGLDTAKKGIDFWANSLTNTDNQNQPGIIFYGGEPLLNLGVFVGCLDYIDQLKQYEKLPSNTRLLLDTNGILLTESVAKLLTKHGVEVTIALDEFSEANDIYRKDFQGKGTRKRVLSTLSILQEMEVPAYLSTSLTPHNMGTLEKFTETMKQYGIRGVGINVLRGKIPEQMMANESIDYNDYQTQGIRALIDLFKRDKLCGIVEFQTTRRSDAFDSKTSFLNCGGFGEHVVIQPDGRIGNCPWTRDYDIGNVANTCSYNDVKGNNFFYTKRTTLPLFNKDCLQCEAISICGGKCIWSDEQSDGKSKSFCLLSQEMLKLLVWKNIVNLENDERKR